MTSPSDFHLVLRELDATLPLPVTHRLRILREVEADLVDFSEQLRTGGLEEGEARRRAADALVPRGHAVHALRALHAPFYRRLTRHLGEDRLRRWERGGLVGASILVTGAGCIALLGTDLARGSSPLLWVVAGLGAALLVVATSTALGLWVRPDHTRPAQGLSLILTLSAAILATGLGGVLLGIFRLAAAAEARPEFAASLALDWLIRDATLLSAALLLALTGALAWFVLASWVTLVEEARRRVLGLGTVNFN